MFGQPYTGGTPDEQPGALPEILPSPDFDGAGPNDANIDRCWSCRAMFMQAWGHYGTAWPVVHQQLGVRPDMGRGRLEVVPQLPVDVADRAAEDIRLGERRDRRVGGPRRRALPHDGRHGRHAGAPSSHRAHAAARVAACGR